MIDAKHKTATIMVAVIDGIRLEKNTIDLTVPNSKRYEATFEGLNFIKK